MSRAFKLILLLLFIATVVVIIFNESLGLFFHVLFGILLITDILVIVVAINASGILEKTYIDKPTYEELIEDAEIYDEYSYTADSSLYDDWEYQKHKNRKYTEKDTDWVDALFRDEDKS